jgi:hypothetical protein
MRLRGVSDAAPREAAGVEEYGDEEQVLNCDAESLLGRGRASLRQGALMVEGQRELDCGLG